MIRGSSSTTSTPSSGRSTGSDLWAGLSGLACGLALSGALRWNKRQKKLRSLLVAWGLNLMAAGWAGVALTVGSEPGGLGGRWLELAVWFGAAILPGLAAFRFPRSVGLPLLAASAAGAWLVAGAVKEFQPLPVDFVGPQVQPLTDRETVTSFAVRADFLIPPEIPLVPEVLYRLRPGAAEPGEWWWSWAVARGWARSEGAPLPDHPMKFGVYRLSLAEGPRWLLVAPEEKPPLTP